ncbi:glutamine--fructose-6-phosphate transaminase (isomerizing) [Paraburkholderia sp. 1N]|uniref:Glutamine--fructose-6-phosphate aminotransferase [isomerizing] n=1 Tax=Paraburkholderia solitsugae TaxID=2675748 RepID=A0ABX2BGQ0_9BURK|nr:glutamine--fructose-6-phosphate transaminase (isomerizing) [Paraburkholderia solitsugae]NPT39794.1 glutamine--fructose-6-phosphate transaminase (isomerizing) [Paraburkholderia solitsugae]
MCGIVGAAGQRDIVPILIEGLRRLEYRGYDSCGVAVLADGEPRRARSVARVADLDEQVRRAHLDGVTGIAHTRWATHGAPVTNNAHPIFSRGAVALVHNGIIENFVFLRDMLRVKGYEFVTQTDTEVITHLIHSVYQGDLFAAVRKAVRQLQGAYAIAVMHKDQPHTVVGARRGSPLVVGLGKGENFLASDTLALANSTDRFIFLEDGDVCELTLERVRIADHDGHDAGREVRTVVACGGAVELGPYRHFMQKEIFEQPCAIRDTIAKADSLDSPLFDKVAGKVFSKIDSLLILACGTSYHSGLTAKYWFESIAKIPTQVEIASEYRYRDSVPNPKSLVVVISQSGETADTLAALKHAQSLGHKHTLAICNVAASAIVRLTKLAFLTQAGREIGVASTKAFTTQLAALFLLAATLGKLRGYVDSALEATYVRQLRDLPAALSAVLALEPQIIAWAGEFARKENALFLGRGLHYPIALEGALKLKEISYIHAEAYPAGELKHGPLALVTGAMPVVTVAPNDRLLEKLKSNMQEVRARGGELYVFADADTRIVNDEGLHVIRMPENYGLLSPILHVVPLQLLAYHTACVRGTDVDKPRNLAKSVTVE